MSRWIFSRQKQNAFCKDLARIELQKRNQEMKRKDRVLKRKTKKLEKAKYKLKSSEDRLREVKTHFYTTQATLEKTVILFI
jgi:hypothetical protein